MSGEGDAGDEESRSDRLRRRRSQRTQSNSERESSATGGDAAGAEAGESAISSDPSDRPSPSEPDETAAGDGVKSEQVGTYMYLPKDQKKEIERLYNVLKANYEYTYDEDFEKNRHFYPMLVQYGLESLDSLDASDIRERLAELRR